MLKFRILLFLLLFCTAIAFGFWSNQWIVFFFLLLISDSLTTKFILRLIRKYLHSRIYEVIKYSWFLIIIAFTAIFCRVFLFEVYFIPSASMEKTLSDGDIIIAEKLSFGPKVPNNLSEIPFGNLLFKNDVTINKSYKRLKGISKIQRNDIILFKKSNGNRTYIKRVIGMPNETLKIVDSKVFVDNSLLPEGINYSFEYKFKDNNINREALLLSNKEYHEFSSKDKIIRNIYPHNSKVDDIFPKEKMFDWNRDNYDSVWIPKKDKTISLTQNSFLLYKEIIEKETSKKIKHTENSNSFMLGNNKIETYTFKNNYYFVLGDNRHFSRDSRSIGFISENFIVGSLLLKI